MRNISVRRTINKKTNLFENELIEVATADRDITQHRQEDLGLSDSS